MPGTDNWRTEIMAAPAVTGPGFGLMLLNVTQNGPELFSWAYTEVPNDCLVLFISVVCLSYC